MLEQRNTVKPLRALIIDDSEQDAILLLRQLQLAGFSTTHKRVDTASALERALKEQEWDVILCDYVMPGFSGIKALQITRGLGLDIPVIIVSGQIGEDTAVEAMRAGANDYIMKGNWKRLGPAIERELAEAVIRRQRREVEKELKAKEEELNLAKKMDALKDEFIGMVSHELKTPLTVIIGAISVAMNENVPDAEAKTLIKDAADSAQDLAVMVDNLLELSRSQSQRLRLQAERTSIGRLVDSVMAGLKDRSAIHQIVADIPEKLPSALVDPIRIDRVLHNLIDNAIKYSPEGGQVRVFCRHKDDEIIVGVADKGIGIAVEDQARLFQNFQRLDVQRRYDISGVGLGLRVCRTLVEAHGGRIWVESRKEEGSTFCFTVPVAK